MTSRKRSLPNNSNVSVLYKELDEASCPICMDHPHNAVALICSSYDKGCRSYICDTSYRHSNCLDRYKKLKEENADTSTENVNSISSSDVAVDRSNYRLAGSNTGAFVGLPEGSVVNGALDTMNSESEEQEAMVRGRLNLQETSAREGLNLKCPLCRGHVLGWKVVEEARNYLNLKSRCCSHESCSFLGNYRELRRHARRVHPTVRPADVDPSRQRAWRHLVDQREYNDIVSAIRSAMPGAILLGDYVIENGVDRLSVERDRSIGGGESGGRLLSTFFLFHMMGSMDPGGDLRSSQSRALPRHNRGNGTLSRRRYLWGENLLGLQNADDDDQEDEDNEPELIAQGDPEDDARLNPRRRRRLTRSQSDDDQ